MPELLIELASEEIPARMQLRAIGDGQHLAEKLLTENEIFQSEPKTDIKVWITPRRLVIAAEHVASRRPDRIEIYKGPRVGAPAKAVMGFVKARGLISPDDCETEPSEKGERYIVKKAVSGEATALLLPALIHDFISQFPWPKSMRWGQGRIRWVRPLTGLFCLFDGQPIEIELDLGGGLRLASSAKTYGHPVLSPSSISPRSLSEYREQMEQAKVILDQEERRNRIYIDLIPFKKHREEQESQPRQGVDKLSSGDRSKKLVEYCPSEVYSLLFELACLIEWPELIEGSIDPDMMQDLPEGIILTVMRKHQRYIPLRFPPGSSRGDSSSDFYRLDDNGEPIDDDGKPIGPLAPHFGAIVDGLPDNADKKARIIQGHERVLRARLSDACFFWARDQSLSLDEHRQRLAGKIFHAQLGTLEERSRRLETLAGEIASSIPDADLDVVKQAARLCKADLATETVDEFPELHGYIGAHLARAQGEEDEVAQAIRDHVQQRYPEDDHHYQVRSEVLAVVLADRLDLLVGFFSIGAAPTGSKDPFGLRRAAISLNRLLFFNDELISSVSLGHYLVRALEGYWGKCDPYKKQKYFQNFKPIPFRPDKAEEKAEEKAIQRPCEQSGCDESEKEAMRESSRRDECVKAVLDFIIKRLDMALKNQGLCPDVMRAVCHHESRNLRIGYGEDNRQRFYNVHAIVSQARDIQGFLGGDKGPPLLMAYRRVANIVRAERWDYDRSEVYGKYGAFLKSNKVFNQANAPTKIDENLFRNPAENKLFERYDKYYDRILAVLPYHDKGYTPGKKGSIYEAMKCLAELCEPINIFFETVRVYDDDKKIRDNRLVLLIKIYHLMDYVADFSQIQSKGG